MKVTMVELDSELAKVRDEQKALQDEIRQLRLDINPALDIEDKIREKDLRKSGLEYNKSSNELSAKFVVKENIHNRNEADISSKRREVNELEAEIVELENMKVQLKEQDISELPVEHKKENRFINFVKKIFNKNQNIKEDIQPKKELDEHQVQQIEIDISEKREKIESINKSIDSIEKENAQIGEMRTERTTKIEEERKAIESELNEITNDIQKLNDEKTRVLESATPITKQQKKEKLSEIADKRKKIDENKEKINQIQSMQKEIDPTRYILDDILPEDIFPGGGSKDSNEMMQKVAEKLKQPKKNGLEVSDEQHKKIFGDNSNVQTSQENKEAKNNFVDNLQDLVEPEDKVIKKEMDTKESIQRDEPDQLDEI